MTESCLMYLHSKITVYLPKGVEKNIEDWITWPWKKMVVSNKNKKYKVKNGLLINKRRKSVYGVVDDREEAIIPNGIKKMDDYFVFNNVKKVYIPQSIKYFGEQQAIRSKKYFVVSKNNPYFFSKKGNIFLRKTGKRL